MLVLSKSNCETNEVPLSGSSTAGVPRHSPTLFFPPFFWSKQKMNVSKSGPYKPNLKLTWLLTAEGQTWKQRSILEVWAGLVSLAVTQRAVSQVCQGSPQDFQAEVSCEPSKCALGCHTAEVCDTSAPPVIVRLFSKLPDLLKPLLVKLSQLGGAAVIDGENRMGLVRAEVNAQLQPIKLYHRKCPWAESFDSRLQYFYYNFRNFFWAACKEMAYISWSFCTHKTVLWGLSSSCLCSLSEYQPLKWRYLNGHAEITITQTWPRLVIK